MSLESHITKEDNENDQRSVEINESDRNQETMVSEAISKISGLYVESAEKYLSDDSELQNAVTDFYSDTSRLSNELSNVFAEKSESYITDYVNSIENICTDENTFRDFAERHIESLQSTTERANSFKRRDMRIANKPIGTAEEYELGAFKDSLEHQVSDAVFELHNRGYAPFESGMTEDPSSRDQFIGFYDKEISLPTALVDELHQQGVGVLIKKFVDRTQIVLHPEKQEKIRLSEWKAVWNFLAENMPTKEKEVSGDREVYGYHRDFRKFQESL
jgi:hypothetical protein